MLIFGFHVAKTGGTSVMHHVKNHLGDDAYFGYGNHLAFRRFFADKPLWEELSAEERAPYKFVFGHNLGQSILTRVTEPSALFAVIRDPYTHFVSHFKHHYLYMKRQGKTLTAREHLEARGANPITANMLRYFGAFLPGDDKSYSEDTVYQLLSQFRFLCTTERLAEQSSELCNIMGIPPVTGRHRVTQHDADLDDISMEEVYELSPIDRKVHEILMGRDSSSIHKDPIAFDQSAYQKSIERVTETYADDNLVGNAYKRLKNFLVSQDALEAAQLYLALQGQEDAKFAPILDAQVPQTKLCDPMAIARAEKMKASVYMRAGKTKYAIPCFEKAIQFNPEYAEALSEFSQILLRRGNLKRAERLASRSLKTNKHDKRAKRVLEKVAQS